MYRSYLLSPQAPPWRVAGSLYLCLTVARTEPETRWGGPVDRETKKHKISALFFLSLTLHSTPWNRVLLEKLIVGNLVIRFEHAVEHRYLP
jgi:hypothetical protein